MENSPGTELHLVIDSALTVARTAKSVAGEPTAQVLQTLRVPAGVSFLRPNAASRELLHNTAGPHSLILEPQPDGPQPRLLLLAPRGIPAPMVNGRRAPRVCLLRVGDQLLLDDGRLLHVTAYDEPRVGALAEQQAELRCPVCRTPFKKNARVFTCACGSTLHYDTADTPADKRLLCATLSGECASCRRPIRLEGGFQYVPDHD